jgi:thioredoxin-like negative regulator of GroEL
VADRTWAASGLEILRTADFSNQRLNRVGTYVVCFGATWCPVTRRLMPKFEAAKGSLPGVLAVADITDMEDPLWDTFQIKITPSIIVFQDGVLRTRVDGRRFLGVTTTELEKLKSTLRVNPRG